MATSTRRRAQATADEIKADGGTAIVRRTDVTQRADVDALVDLAASEFGRVDIVGNIAGIPHNKLVADCTDEEFERILAINLKSVFYGCQAAIRHMIPQGSGNIVNISSGAIDTPAPTLACYGMTKAAVAMLTKTLATEVGRHGIRVNAIAPGMILTNFSRHNFVDEEGNVDPREARAVPQARGRDGAARPRRRSRRTSRSTFLYLVSDAASVHHRADRTPQRRRRRCPGSAAVAGRWLRPRSAGGPRTRAPPCPFVLGDLHGAAVDRRRCASRARARGRNRPRRGRVPRRGG